MQAQDKAFLERILNQLSVRSAMKPNRREWN